MSEQASESEVLAQVLTELKLLRRQVAEQQKEIARLKSSVPPQIIPPPEPLTTRRRMLGRLAGVMLAGVAVVGSGALAGTAQANVVAGSNPGAYILPKGAAITGFLPGYRYGLVASSDANFDQGNLIDSDTGVSGVSTTSRGVGVFGLNTNAGIGVLGYNTDNLGIGVYGYVNTGLGIGVYGFSDSAAGLGVSGANLNGTAIYGDSGYSFGVHGRSYGGVGVLAESSVGVPLKVYPGLEPTVGTRSYGDIYVDATGKIYIWADGASPVSPGWRQLQFAT